MRFKVRKLIAKYRTGAGLDSPVSGVIFYGKKINPTNKMCVDGTEWFQFLYRKKFVWVNIEDLKIRS